jgi:hypothetical protein
MARRVYADHEAELHVRIAKRTDITAAQRGHFLNDALLWLINEYPHPEYEGIANETILISTDELLPITITDFWWPSLIKNSTTGRPIDGSSKEDIESRQKVSGEVTEYYFWAGKLFFDRIASAATNIRIWYKKQPAFWSSGVSPLQALYDSLVPIKAAVFVLSAIGDQKASHLQETEYNNHARLLRLPSHEAERNDRTAGIRVRMR